MLDRAFSLRYSSGSQSNSINSKSSAASPSCAALNRSSSSVGENLRLLLLATMPIGRQGIFGAWAKLRCPQTSCFLSSLVGRGALLRWRPAEETISHSTTHNAQLRSQQAGAFSWQSVVAKGAIQGTKKVSAGKRLYGRAGSFAGVQEEDPRAASGRSLGAARRGKLCIV